MRIGEGERGIICEVFFFFFFYEINLEINQKLHHFFWLLNKL